jgi:SAM-dependent methyltransferase
MTGRSAIRASYDAVAEPYAARFWDELDKKHLGLAEVEPALREARRVLKPGGLFLFTFHALEGEEQVTLRTFLDTEVEELTFHFFDPDRMRTLVEGVGFQVLDVLVRHPYPDVEYASKRAYFVLRRP